MDMRKQASQLYVALIVAFLALSGGIAAAQETTATISGSVRDESGAVIPGASVQVKNVATGVNRTVQTDAQGRYTVPQLAPGMYEVESSSSGFQTFIRRGIELTVGRHATVDITLQVGAVTQRVEVTGEVSLVNTTTAATSGLIGDKEIRELPLNGRNFVQLALLEPGVVQSRSAGSSAVVGGGVKLNFNGARMDANNYIVDGTSANSVNQQAIGGASGQAMGVEAIQEFQVLTSNYSAEFGRGGGGVINVVSKSGTNELHGSAFEFLRNSALDARSFFDGKSVPPFKRNQFGGSLGGPLKREKTFVFGAYEGLRERLGQTLIGNVPTAAARLGNLGTAGTFTVADAVKPYLPLWPLPSPGGRDLGDGRAEFTYAPSQPTRQDYGNVRVDHNFSSNDSFFVRYTMDDSIVEKPQTIPNYILTDVVRSQIGTIGETRIISSALLNVFRFGFNRSAVFFTQAPLDPRVEDRSLWFFSNPSIPNLGVLGVTGLSEPGGASNLPRNRVDNVYQVVDTVNYTSGRHSLKFGGEFQRIQTNGQDDFRGQGVYSFANLTNFLRAIPAQFIGVEPGGSSVAGWRQSLFALFIQDDVRLRPRFTLNLGFRWEFITSPNEVNGRTSHYEGLFTTDTLVTGNPPLLLPKGNFSPRIGFAWDVRGDGKTAVRGGFGRYYSMIFRNFYFSSVQIPPWYVWLSANAPNLSFPHPLPDLAGGAIAAELPQYKDNSVPYMMQWNLSVQREIVPGTVVGAGYVGTRGLHLARFSSLNVAFPDPNVLATTGRYYYPAGAPLRDPNFTTYTHKSLSSSSRYNALQVKASHRFSRGLQAQAAYTWAHSTDMGSAQLNGDYGNSSPHPQNPWDINNTEWGHSAFDLRHVMSVNYTYTLPFGAGTTGAWGKLIQGWQTNGILSATTGVPFTIENSAGLNRARQGLGPPTRPDLVAGMSNNPTSGVTAGCTGVAAGQKLGGPDLFYDPCAFKLQDLGYYGNLGRNTVIGPGLTSFDFALVKNTGFGEGKGLQFRWEVFNLFNHANFALPNRNAFLAATGVASSNAGRITSTVTSSRQMQFGLKISF